MIKISEICPKCGLPKEICVCKTIEQEGAQKIKMYTTKKKFGKFVTVIEGIEKNSIENVTKTLKRKLACGGSAKKGIIVLQGDHKMRVKEELTKIGYPEENISVV